MIHYFGLKCLRPTFIPLNDNQKHLIPIKYLFAARNKPFKGEDFVFTPESQRKLRKRTFSDDEGQVILSHAER